MGYKISTERLAYWYLRLNGFLTIENFIVHNEIDGPQRTDCDLIALRFPYRKEALHDSGSWMKDDQCFIQKNTPFAAFVEVTSGRCKINGPWTDSSKNNIPRVLRALGALPDDQVERASKHIYTDGQYCSDSICLGLVSIGKAPNYTLQRKVPNSLQICWEQVTDFIFDRFSEHEKIKTHHPQWHDDGRKLWSAFQSNRSKPTFASALGFDIRNENSTHRRNLLS